MIELIRPILDRPFFYKTYHSLVGADARARILVNEYILPRTREVTSTRRLPAHSLYSY